jgi:hypothetical protein
MHKTLAGMQAKVAGLESRQQALLEHSSSRCSAGWSLQQH